MSTLYFTKDHLWCRIEDEEHRLLRIGISNYGQESFGELVYIDIVQEIRGYTQGNVLAVIESSKIASDIYYPFDCTLQEINTSVQDNPRLINSSPMEKGWLVKVIMENTEHLQQYMSEAEYLDFIKE